MEYTANTLIPHVRRAVKRLGLRDSQKALCIFNVSRAQMGEVINDDLKKKDYIYCVAPSCTDRQQPMDLNPLSFKPLSTVWRVQVHDDILSYKQNF